MGRGRTHYVGLVTPTAAGRSGGAFRGFIAARRGGMSQPNPGHDLGHQRDVLNEPMRSPRLNFRPTPNSTQTANVTAARSPRQAGSRHAVSTSQSSAKGGTSIETTPSTVVAASTLFPDNARVAAKPSLRAAMVRRPSASAAASQRRPAASNVRRQAERQKCCGFPRLESMDAPFAGRKHHHFVNLCRARRCVAAVASACRIEVSALNEPIEREGR